MNLDARKVKLKQMINELIGLFFWSTSEERAQKHSEIRLAAALDQDKMTPSIATIS
jgi:hypothetical protein